MSNDENKTTPRNGDLKVWWIPQIPGRPFERPVRNLQEAKLLVETLADYDAFQFKNNIKPDYCNAGGLMVYMGDEWSDWYDEATGRSFDEWRHDEHAAAPHQSETLLSG